MLSNKNSGAHDMTTTKRMVGSVARRGPSEVATVDRAPNTPLLAYVETELGSALQDLDSLVTTIRSFNDNILGSTLSGNSGSDTGKEINSTSMRTVLKNHV